MANTTASPSATLSVTPLPSASVSATPSLSQSPSATTTATSVPSISLVPSPQPTTTGLNPCPRNSQFTVLCDLKISQIGPYISQIITVILIFSVIIALFSLLLGGIRWIISGGDKTKTAAARDAVIAALVGLVLVFLAYFILNVVLSMFGLSLTKLSLPPLPFPKS